MLELSEENYAGSKMHIFNLHLHKNLKKSKSKIDNMGKKKKSLKSVGVKEEQML